MKFLHAFQDACSEDVREKYAEVARGLILRDEGLPYLTDPYKNDQADLLNFLLSCKDDVLPSVIEAIARTLTIPTYEMGVSFSYRPRVDPEYFTKAVNIVLREHRISFELIEGQLVPLKSQELHAEIVAPTLRLLSGRAGLDKVEAAYQDALGELADGKPADAITDAATALQEMLLARGCKATPLVP